MASVSSCVQEVAIDRLCVVQLPRPKNCLRLYTHEAHNYLATLANYHNERVQSVRAYGS